MGFYQEYWQLEETEASQALVLVSMRGFPLSPAVVLR
jgi:hypothetical protein